MKKKLINYNEKKMCRKLNFGLLPKYIARGAIVLQLSAVGWKDCIAIGWVGWQIVLQYSLGQPVSQDGRLRRDTALSAGWGGGGGGLGALGARGARRALAERAGWRAWVRGRVEQAAGRAGVGRSGRAGVRSAQQGAGRAAGATGARASGALGRAGWAAGAQAGLGLCTRCTRPIFSPVRLGIFPESIFGHCS